MSSRNSAVLNIVWYLNKRIICWDAEISLKLFIGMVFCNWVGLLLHPGKSASVLFLEKNYSFLSSYTNSPPTFQGSSQVPEYSLEISFHVDRIFFLQFIVALYQVQFCNILSLCTYRWSFPKFTIREGWDGNLPCTFTVPGIFVSYLIFTATLSGCINIPFFQMRI